MRVAGARVGRARELQGRGLVRRVNDGERVLVRVEAYLATAVLLVGAAVDDALSLVDVAVVVHTAREGGRGGVARVNHVQAAAARGSRAGACVHVGRAVRVGLTPRYVEVARLLVNGDGVGAAEVVVVRGLAEGDGRRLDVTQLRQVEDL